ncbi:hypothetical protein [Nocardia thraciensis]
MVRPAAVHHFPSNSWTSTSAARPLLEPLLAGGRYPAFARWFRGRTGAGPADPVCWTLG